MDERVTLPEGVLADRRKPGRPRCSAIEASIKRATIELLEIQGYANLTMEGVAARAGVGKATIYRWWPSKAKLTIDVFLEYSTHAIVDPCTGSLAQDLRFQLKSILELFQSPHGKIIGSLIAAAQSSEELRTEFCQAWMLRRRAVTLATLNNAVTRGELPPTMDLELMLDCLMGPLYLSLMIGHRQLTEADIDAIIDQVLHLSKPIATMR